jgi:hypothetical protein
LPLALEVAVTGNSNHFAVEQPVAVAEQQLAVHWLEVALALEVAVAGNSNHLAVEQPVEFPTSCLRRMKPLALAASRAN